jgi:hypothetical protein
MRRFEFVPILLDLSWNSSRLEGNAYSLLESVSDSSDTQRDASVAALIAQSERASSRQAARRDKPTAEKSESPNTKRK